MTVRSIILIVILASLSIVASGQVVASIDTSVDFAEYNASSNNQLSYSIIAADTNVQFSKVNYSISNEQLTMDAKDEIQFISLLKDGKYYLTNMPVLSKNLRLSMRNYDPGNYELHLMIKGKIVPTVIEIKK